MTTTAGSTDKLISLGSGPIGGAPAHFRTNIVTPLKELGRALVDFLKRKNGFYAFESALHIFPACNEQGIMDLEKWNAPDLWKGHYEDMASDIVFYAEDIFGNQFGMQGREILRFEAETGLTEQVATSLEGWASLILEDYNYLTGYPLAHKWQERHGPLNAGKRLVAVRPFVLGGDFDISNLFALEAVKAMRYHGDLAVQIRDVPNGTKITFEFGD